MEAVAPRFGQASFLSRSVQPKFSHWFGGNDFSKNKGKLASQRENSYLFVHHLKQVFDRFLNPVGYIG